MQCKKCKTDDWYVRGSYKRCRECHRRTLNRAYHNRKIDSPKQRKHLPSRSLAQEIKVLSPAAIQKRMQTTCYRGHELTTDNVRLDIDRKGRQHRRCLKCDRLKQRRKYGIETESRIAELMTVGERPWERMDREID